MDAGATLHFIGGGAVDVAEDTITASTKLWGREPGGDVADMGYAAMQTPAGKPLNVNPQAVAFITEPPVVGDEPLIRLGD